MCASLIEMTEGSLKALFWTVMYNCKSIVGKLHVKRSMVRFRNGTIKIYETHTAEFEYSSLLLLQLE